MLWSYSWQYFSPESTVCSAILKSPLVHFWGFGVHSWCLRSPCVFEVVESYLENQEPARKNKMDSITIVLCEEQSFFLQFNQGKITWLFSNQAYRSSIRNSGSRARICVYGVSCLELPLKFFVKIRNMTGEAMHALPNMKGRLKKFIARSNRVIMNLVIQSLFSVDIFWVLWTFEILSSRVWSIKASSGPGLHAS